MFKTIFSKLIAIIIALLLFGFSVTGVMLYYFLGNFLTTEKERALDNSADKINGYLKVLVENQDNPAVRNAFEYILESYAFNTNSLIWVVLADGYIYMNKPAIPDQMAANLKNESGHLRLPDERQYKKVMAGQGSVIERGNFYGLFKYTGVSWLTVEKPFKYVDKDGKEQVAAAVYFHTPIPEIHRRSSVIQLFIFSVLVSIALSIILAYILSLRISRPLKEINNAARVIAGGEFQKRLNINSQDEIGELANSFNYMVSALQNLEQMRRDFIANVSHELRTPMTSIRGFIEGILDGTIPPEKQNDYLTIVRDEANRLNRLVNDLLDLARMEAGEVTLNYKSFNINELVRRCIIKLESLIVQKEIQIEAEFDEEDIYVTADADAIERVVINLIHNALKFTSEHGKIVIKTVRQKDRILVSVKDNGVGIDSSELDLIWQRFHKSDKSRGKDKTGTGLGLAIVKNIINEHKQEIWVQSQLGEGTEFIFTLDKADGGES